MASLRKRGKTWFCRSRDASGAQKEVKCGPDRSVATQIKHDLEGKLQRIKAGTLDPREADVIEADRIPISRHIKDYAAHLAARGCVPEHITGVQRRLEWFAEEAKISRLS